MGEQYQMLAFQSLIRGANAMRRSVLLLGALCVVVCCKLTRWELKQGVFEDAKFSSVFMYASD